MSRSCIEQSESSWRRMSGVEEKLRVFKIYVCNRKPVSQEPCWKEEYLNEESNPDRPVRSSLSQESQIYLLEVMVV
jgi:hypothetical protein